MAFVGRVHEEEREFGEKRARVPGIAAAAVCVCVLACIAGKAIQLMVVIQGSSIEGMGRWNWLKAQFNGLVQGAGLVSRGKWSRLVGRFGRGKALIQVLLK
eukprot:scaffold193806_cov17-Tisochrysis_lutea.AAC.1